MQRKKIRQLELLIVSLAMLALALFILVIALAVMRIPEARGEALSPDTPTPRQTLPQKCQEFYGEPNDLWINCMGVGRR